MSLISINVVAYDKQSALPSAEEKLSKDRHESVCIRNKYMQYRNKFVKLLESFESLSDGSSER